jgi:hypothetical protein
MKICKGCGREYVDGISDHENPIYELGELFLKATNREGENDLCPDCREEAGIFTMLGFGQ